MTAFWIFIGGGLGSLARFGMSKMVGLWSQSSFPLATFISNMLACALLVLIVYLLPTKSENPWLQSFLIIGFCGGFSTFSTFSYENYILFSNGQWQMAALNIILSLGIGIGVMLTLMSKSNQ